MRKGNSITIQLSETIKETTYFTPGEIGNNYDLIIGANPNSTYEQIKSNIPEMMRQIKNDSDWSKKVEPELFASSIEFNNKVLSGEVVLFENIESIYIEASLEEARTFISSSPELANYKIVLSGINVLDSEALNEAYSYFKNYTNIYCFDEMNVKEKTLEECIKDIKKPDEIVKQVKEYDYSPFEQLLCAYDIVSELIQKENKDLTDTNQISTLFETVVTKLGIPVKTVQMASKSDRHINYLNAVYLKDDKYGIEGVYYIDIPSNKTYIKDAALGAYLGFAKTKSQYEVITNNELEDLTFPAMTEKLLYEIQEISSFDINMPEKYKKTFYRVAHFLGDRLFTYYLGTGNQEEVINYIEKYDKLFKNRINNITFLKTLINVRKNEYYKNPEKYSFSEEELIKTVVLSLFDSNKYSEEASFAEEFFLEVPDAIECITDELSEYSEQNDLPKQIEQVRVAKVLSKVLETKTNK